MAKLILGPLLRYVGETDATIWVETDTSCEVEVSGHRSRTFQVEGHHYAIVCITGLEPAHTYPYTVSLDAQLVWPEADSTFPPSVIRTIDPDQTIRLVFGSCRVTLPHEPPYTLSKDEDERGREVDALYALALRMRREPQANWPHVLLFLGDQIYADEVSPSTDEFIRSRRKPECATGLEVADFEEYTHLYLDAWGDPVLRWLLSTVSTLMIFDDHDMHDDWNISEAWVATMRSKPWWDERIVSGFMSYWIYQHLGNLSPADLEEDAQFEQVQRMEDGGEFLRAFAFRADREVQGSRWSYCRDFGTTRLVVLDARAGRVVSGGRRQMIDEEEWDWVERHATGDCDHLLIATSVPFLLAPAIHYLEAWNEAVCAGVWGDAAARQGERLRQAIDLEHWAAFEKSFHRLKELLRAVGAGEHGRAPRSIVILSGDVHHAYLAQAAFKPEAVVQSAIYQAVCSPVRNSLDVKERYGFRTAWSKPVELIAQALALTVGIKRPDVRWHLLHDRPWFHNQIASIELSGPKAQFRLEKALPGHASDPHLEVLIDHRLA